MIAILLAVPELGQEPDLVTGAAGAGLQVLRRCVDAVDLLAAAAADPSAAVVVSPALPRLSADAVARLRIPAGRSVVGLAGDEPGVAHLRRWGVETVLVAGPTPAATLAALGSALDPGSIPPSSTGVWPTGMWEPPEALAAAGQGRGRVIAVWGPMGAPGRTTVAVGVAEALSDAGRSVCLVDADTYAPSVALTLGILDDSGGLARACRHADTGTLTSATLQASTRRLRHGLHVLTGLAPADRWADLRPSGLDAVWECCRTAFDVTVVDVGFCLEDDAAAGPLGRRRNAAALGAMSVADHVIAVGDGSALGAARLSVGWIAASSALGGADVTVVCNRARGAAGPWIEAVRAFGVSAAVARVPSDPRALEACWRRGRSLGEGARRSRIRRALAAVATEVVPP